MSYGVFMVTNNKRTAFLGVSDELHWIHLAQRKDQWHVFAQMATKPPVS
jgi:hypothetical protein